MKYVYLLLSYLAVFTLGGYTFATLRTDQGVELTHFIVTGGLAIGFYVMHRTEDDRC